MLKNLYFLNCYSLIVYYNTCIFIFYKQFAEFMGHSFFKLDDDDSKLKLEELQTKEFSKFPFIHITRVHEQPELNTHFKRVNEIR